MRYIINLFVTPQPCETLLLLNIQTSPFLSCFLKIWMSERSILCCRTFWAEMENKTKETAWLNAQIPKTRIHWKTSWTFSTVNMFAIYKMCLVCSGVSGESINPIFSKFRNYLPPHRTPCSSCLLYKEYTATDSCQYKGHQCASTIQTCWSEECGECGSLCQFTHLPVSDRL